MKELGQKTAEKLSMETQAVVRAGFNAKNVVEGPNTQRPNKMNLQKIIAASKGNDSK